MPGAAPTDAVHLSRAGESGVIASGARADLVIVDGDPLRDMGLLRDRRTLQAAIVESDVFHKNQHGRPTRRARPRRGGKRRR